MLVVSSGIFSRPDHAKLVYPEVQQNHLLPLSLICDNIRDPGNLGTILRSAAGAGCSRVLLVKGREHCLAAIILTFLFPWGDGKEKAKVPFKGLTVL